MIKKKSDNSLQIHQHMGHELFHQYPVISYSQSKSTRS